MTHRERLKAVLRYESYDRLPIVNFGYWKETLRKWCVEGYLSREEIAGARDGSDKDRAIGAKLGFDFNYYTLFEDKSEDSLLYPAFEPLVLGTLDNGKYLYRNEAGVTQIKKDGVSSISAETDHLLKDRKSWEEHFLPRLQYTEKRFDMAAMDKSARESASRTEPLGLHCKRLFGEIRDWMGIEGVSYLYADDESLYDEIIDTVGTLTYKVTEHVLSSGIQFDFGHFWEDICYKNGPLVPPKVFKEKVGPYYKRITELLNRHRVNIVSVDCDGMIDSLIPTWIENGVNTMFPIEVGTWGASIAPWREKYGKRLIGVGGMNKTVFARDYSAVDVEIERLKPLVEMGGYIPCPDHRIPPDAKWENVQYYCDRMRRIFG